MVKGLEGWANGEGRGMKVSLGITVLLIFSGLVVKYGMGGGEWASG